MTIALACELVAEPARVRRQLALAKALRARGRNVVLICPEITSADTRELDVSLIATPRLIHRTQSRRIDATYTRTLLNAGYDDPQALAALVEAWTHLLKMVSPATLVADYCPTGLLAARLLKLPRIALGEPCTIPSYADAFRPGVDESSSRRIMTSCNVAMTELKGPALHDISDLCASIPQIVTSYKVLDSSPDREQATYIGPIISTSQNSDVWREPDSERPRILMHLSRHTPGLRSILQQLRESNCEVAGSVGDGNPPANAGSRLKLSPNLLCDHSLVDKASIVISNAAEEIIAAAAAAGVPHIMLPLHFEQHNAGTRVQHLDLGAIAATHEVTGTLRRVVSSEKILRSAQEFSAIHKVQSRGLEAAVDTILSASH